MLYVFIYITFLGHISVQKCIWQWQSNETVFLQLQKTRIFWREIDIFEYINLKIKKRCVNLLQIELKFTQASFLLLKKISMV